MASPGVPVSGLGALAVAVHVQPYAAARRVPVSRLPYHDGPVDAGGISPIRLADGVCA